MKRSREEQVWRMAKDLCALNQRCEECNVYPDCKAKLYAERAIDNGYSKTSEVVKEFVMRFEHYIKDTGFTIGQTYDIQYALKKATEEITGVKENEVNRNHKKNR